MSRLSLDLSSLLLTLSEALPRLLEERLVGLYVYGSLFDSTFNPDTGDVDCIVVTDGPLNESDLDGLRAWLEQAGAENQWVGKLQISFLKRGALLEDDPEACLFQSGKLSRGGSDGNPLIWMDLLLRGRTLVGPAPSDLLPEITNTMFHEALKREVGYLEEELCLEGGGEWRDKEAYRTYAVLTLCRIIYSHSTGKLVSKAVAGGWALENLPATWHPLVEAALRGGGAGEIEVLPLESLCEFVPFAQSTVETGPPGPPQIHEGELGRALGVPKEIWEAHPNALWSLAWMFTPEAVTYRLAGPAPEVRYLKVASQGWYPSLESEVERLEWAQPFLPVPRVLESGSDGRKQWLITEGIPGRNGVDPVLAQHPEELVRTLASGLKRFHQAPVSECPFDFSLDRAIAHARRRVESGAVRPEEDFHPEFAHLSGAEALALLERNRPESESLVVCHGDYCPPNVLIEGWDPSGFVDLGELGVADRWWDLAVATWSVTWNFGPGLEGLFLRAYGIERDQARIEYYRLLYDLVS